MCCWFAEVKIWEKCQIKVQMEICWDTSALYNGLQHITKLQHTLQITCWTMDFTKCYQNYNKYYN